MKTGILIKVRVFLAKLFIGKTISILNGKMEIKGDLILKSNQTIVIGDTMIITGSLTIQDDVTVIQKKIFPGGIKVRVDLNGSLDANDKRHAQQIMKDLGIEYLAFEAMPIADCWMFYGIVENTIPTDLPTYVEVIKEKS